MMMMMTITTVKKLSVLHNVHEVTHLPEKVITFNHTVTYDIIICVFLSLSDGTTVQTGLWPLQLKAFISSYPQLPASIF
jgi:hypothetical protein